MTCLWKILLYFSPHQAVSVENVKDFGHCRFCWKAELRKWLAIQFACMELCQEQRETLLRGVEREYKGAVITHQAIENWDSYRAGWLSLRGTGSNTGFLLARKCSRLAIQSRGEGRGWLSECRRDICCALNWGSIRVKRAGSRSRMLGFKSWFHHLSAV